MKTLEINNQEFLIPESWDELTAKQATALVKQSFLLALNKIDYSLFKLRTLYIICNIKRTPLSAFRERLMTRDQLERKYDNIRLMADEFCEFIISEKDNVFSINYNTTNIHIPYFIAKGKKYYSPSETCLNLTFQEFRHCVSLLIESSKDPLNSLIQDQLIASLYRTETPNYNPIFHPDRRKSFNTLSVNHDALQIKKLPPYMKFMIVRWFDNCVNYITSGDLYVNGSTVNFSKLFSSKDSDDDNSDDESSIGLLGVLFSIASAGTFGTASEVDETHFIDIFLSIYHNEKLNSKLKHK
jgi:hypothetical protein